MILYIFTSKAEFNWVGNMSQAPLKNEYYYALAYARVRSNSYLRRTMSEAL